MTRAPTTQEIDLARKIEQKANDTIRRLETEMQVMGWKPEYRSIMWSAVAIEATRRATATARG